MKGQISIELFFAFALFLLVLVWLNSFLSLSNTELDAISSQKRFLASQVASIANSACATGATIYYDAPCLIEKTPGFDSSYKYLDTALEFGLSTSPGVIEFGNQVNASQLLYKPISVKTSCNLFPGSIALNCQVDPFSRDKPTLDGYTKLCFKYVDDPITLTRGVRILSKYQGDCEPI
ncbi:hypothetical protein HUU53_03040 [Candidatus Micrarchaeota archaeon]|nr:hypothetical protein [Candidatus Micrarchaeota archaeon]